MKKIALLLFTILFAGCFSAKLIVPSQNDIDRVQVKFPNYTLSELNHGKALFEQNCGKCHGLKNPSSRSEDEWKQIVPRMSKKVNRKTEILDAKAQEDILRYLITMSTAPKAK